MEVGYDNLLQLAITAAEHACREIMIVYESGDFQVQAKDDRSPLTKADRKAHETIVSILQPSGLPVLSEEGKSIPYSVRKDWEHFWLVDPLDGTKEFMKRNGEFTVNIALIYHEKPVLGVVAVPVTGNVFYGLKGEGAHVKKSGKTKSLTARKKADLQAEGLRVVASRSHQGEETEKFLQSLNNPLLVSAGSSLKFMMIATGEADVYPRLLPTMEWDTAASQAIVAEVGPTVQKADDGSELIYNKESLLNPSFLVF